MMAVMMVGVVGIGESSSCRGWLVGDGDEKEEDEG